MTTGHYFPHIDGLRAVALIGVLLFHFEVTPFGGGYAGVDVFLTISGYLITRNVITQHSETSPFSLRRFYIRRFFRLYPAATAIVLISALATTAVLPNNLAKDALASALASMLVCANAFFHAKSGYFDSSATLKPLLHMWSLSLEEQFYLLWAPLLLIHFKMLRPHKAVAIIKFSLAVLTVASIFAAWYSSINYPSFAFFHLPARIFQFAIGAALAAWQCERETNSDTLSAAPQRSRGSWLCMHAYSILTAVALVIVLFAYTMLPENAPLLALLPVNLATAILIANPDEPLCKHVLSSTACVSIGRLSYAAYLVHWPIYVFSRFVRLALNDPKPNPVTMAAATLVLALIVKHGIEDPVRKPSLIPRAIFAIAAIGTMAYCTASIVSITNDTEPVTNQVDSSANLFLFNKSAPVSTRSDIMQIEAPIVMRRKRILSRVSRTGFFNISDRPVLTVFGNSFASHIIPALHLIGKRRKVWFRVYAAPSCALFAPSEIWRAESNDRNCRKVNELMWSAISELPANSTVMFSCLWGLPTLDVFVNRIARIAHALAERKVKGIFLGEPPGLDSRHESFFDCIDLLEKPVGSAIIPLSKGSRNCGLDFKLGARPQRDRLIVDAIYREAFSAHVKGIKFVDVLGAMCDISRNQHDQAVDANCSLPTLSLLNRFPNLTDPGYKRDLAHLTILGSAAMSHVYERLIFEQI